MLSKQWIGLCSDRITTTFVDALLSALCKSSAERIRQSIYGKYIQSWSRTNGRGCTDLDSDGLTSHRVVVRTRCEEHGPNTLQFIINICRRTLATENQVRGVGRVQTWHQFKIDELKQIFRILINYIVFIDFTNHYISEFLPFMFTLLPPSRSHVVQICYSIIHTQQSDG